MQRLERLFAIRDALRRAAPAKVSAAALSEEFGVSRRTIERDLASLRAAGVPLYAERGRAGGQVSLDRMGNVVVLLTPNQVTALLVSVAGGGENFPFADSAGEAVKHLLDGLPPTTRVAVEDLRDRVRAAAPASDPVNRRIRRTVETAVQRNVILNIEYLDQSDQRSKRSVDPVGFYQGTDGWYLIGWCHLRDAGRIFRLDRIQAANLTTRPAETHDVDRTLGWTPAELRTP